MKLLKNFDFLIPLLVFLISIFGLLLLWGLTPQLFPSQLLFLFLSFVAFLLFSQIEFRVYASFKWFFYLGSILFLISTFILGEVSRGSVRWIQLGPFAIQSSEIVKPFLISFFAFFFADQRVKFKGILTGVGLFLLPAFLVFRQPDLGSTLVISASFIGILLASLPSFYILAGSGMAIVFLPLLWLILADYQKQRFLSFLNPYADPLGSGYNLIQAMISVGSGQIFGKGLGKGTQSRLDFLPEQHTDFIFASFAEEMGFVGSLIILVLYMLLLWRILRVAQNARQNSAQLFCLGVFFMLLFQVFVNVGMNLGLVPVTGITLPLFSYGGSSLLATMICLGIVESIARFQRKQEAIEIR